MSSSISWLDHDSKARERTLRVLSLFNQPESRDELGIGGIRDSIADQLFPGTSTIQTHLRYALFIPWLFAQLEERKVTSSNFPSVAKQAEIQLLFALLKNSPENERGIIGSESKEALKRLPSSVYWAALGSWGLRTFQSTQQQYFAQSDRLYAARSARRRRDDDDLHDGDAHGQVWHPHLLKLRPSGFPNNATLELERTEAEFLLDRWRTMHRDSLFTWLAMDMVKQTTIETVDRAWIHPRFPEFPKQIQTLLSHARCFDALIQGALIQYNLQLAQLDHRLELVEEYESRLADWKEHEASACNNWNIENFWPQVIGKGHSISGDTKTFIQEWLEFAVTPNGNGVNSYGSRQLIETRERKLKEKSGRSRFSNPAALKQWGGRAGLVRLDYRWSRTQSFLTEWHAGWRRK
jgi:hypothetical protein